LLRSSGKLAPKGARTSNWYNARNKDLNGEGLDPAVVPGAASLPPLTVLEQWGTMSFEQVSAARHRICRAGLPDAPAHGERH